jgi:hypothetical protein
MIYEGVYNRCINDSTLSAIVGSRVYQSVLPLNFNGTSGAAITYEIVNSKYAGVDVGAKSVMATRTEIDLSVWSLTYQSAAYGIKAIHNLFDLFQGTLSDGTVVLYTDVASIPSMFEEDTRFYRESVTLTFTSLN